MVQNLLLYTSGTAYIARFNFETEKGEQIVLSTALSGVSMEGAAKNMAAEAPHNDFDKDVYKRQR